MMFSTKGTEQFTHTLVAGSGWRRDYRNSDLRLLIEGPQQAVLEKWSKDICDAIKRQVGA